MYSIDPFEFTMACIVLIGYISGKLWMYYNDTKDTKPKREQSKEDTSGIKGAGNGGN
jgi:hypothetical protein